MRRFYMLITFLAAIIFNGKAQDIKNSADPKPGKNELMIRMSDGTELSSDVYLPKRKGKYPTVLVRTPYNKASEAWMEKALGKLGIAAVVQDVRGKYKSGGEFYGFINERDDGLQTLRWIRAQPWSDGRVAGWEGGAKVRFSGSQPEVKNISVWATGYQLKTGHKLRVFIASSWFPRYNRSLNSCEPISDAKNIVPAHQKVWFGAATPSSVNLPVYESDKLNL